MITRKPDYPEKSAELTGVFSAAAEGYPVNDVMNAAMQVMVISINLEAKSRASTKEQTLAFAQHVCRSLLAEVEANYGRTEHPADAIPVGAKQ